MAPHSKRKADVPDNSDSDGDVDMINVDFDFTGPDEIDYIALKRLFIQLLHTLAPKIDVDTLAEVVINNGARNELGTVIKVVDDVDNDPFAIITPLTLTSAVEAPVPARELHKLLLDKAPSSHPIRDLLLASGRTPPTLLLHERMINLPPQVAAPLYRLLNEELEREYKKGIPKPSHYLIFSRVFSNSALPEDEMDIDEEPSKRQRKTLMANKPGKRSTSDLADDDMGMFHPEDAIISKVRSISRLFFLYTIRLARPLPGHASADPLTHSHMCSMPRRPSTSLSLHHRMLTNSSTRPCMAASSRCPWSSGQR